MREFAIEALADAARLFGGIECRSPDLRAPLGVELGEELVEAGEQIGLGHHQVDRQAHAEAPVQLAHAVAHVLRIPRELFLVPVHEVGDAQRDDHAVQRLARAEALQQIEETEPGCRIGLVVAFLYCLIGFIVVDKAATTNLKIVERAVTIGAPAYKIRAEPVRAFFGLGLNLIPKHLTTSSLFIPLNEKWTN